MRQTLILAITSIWMAGLSSPVRGQMHKVAKPQDVVRAVGVYEWIGDRAKPTATRLIPVSLYIDESFQDAGVYLARPVPFALDIGTIYEVDKAGVPGGNVELISARRLKPVGDTANFDDGWVGYGKFALPATKKAIALKTSKPAASITSDKPDKDSDRPTFARRVDHADAGSAPSTPANGSSPSTSPQPPDDPDRPHLSKKPDASDSAGPDGKAASTDSPTEKTSPVTGSGTSPTDADRPTLRKRTPEEAKRARKESDQSSARGLATSLNEDPDRPTLRRGRGQQELVEADLPVIKGVPTGLNQAVAVSDASNRPVHDFSRSWADDAERTAVLGRMQALAQVQLAAYGVPAAAKPTSATAKPAPSRKPTPTGKPTSRLRHSIVPESVKPGEPLLDEELSGYTLSYGGAATYVYTAHTNGTGDTLRYVTIVAQRDTFGDLKPALQSVTDAAHLDRTPWIRIIDAVDADASNRASLLFELRGQSARQFALYRVIATRSEQVFLTGTTQ